MLFGVLVFVPKVRRTQRASDPLAGRRPAAVVADATSRRIRRRITDHRASSAPPFIVACGVVLFTRGDTVWLFLVTQAVILAIVFLSITVITGIGRPDLAVPGRLRGHRRVHRLPARRPLRHARPGRRRSSARVIAAVVGALLSLPLRRLDGVWIAIATLAFAYFFDVGDGEAPVGRRSASGAARGTPVPRPVIGPWDFDNDKAFLVLVLIVLVVATVAVTLIGLSTTGRTLRRCAGSEVAAQSIGISPARARLIAFAISAFIAALGGAMLAHPAAERRTTPPTSRRSSPSSGWSSSSRSAPARSAGALYGRGGVRRCSTRSS